MGLKDTKATQPPFIKKRSKKSVPASITDEVSLGSRNTSRGLFCENLVLKEYQKRGYQLIERRWKSFFAEIDLLLMAPSGAWVLVEVKSLPSFEYLHIRVTSHQIRRLRRAWQSCLEKRPGTRLELAVVDQRDQVLILPEFLSSQV